VSTRGAVRLAFFISSYGPGEQLHRLVTTLRRSDPSCHVVIHHDVGGAPLTSGLFDGDANVHVIDGLEPIVWGDMTLETARWRVFRWILAELDVDWVMLLSEQDYPLAPVADLKRHLDDSGVDAIISGERIDRMADEGSRVEGAKRYHHRYASLPSSGVEQRLPARLGALTLRARRAAFATVNRRQRAVHLYSAAAELRLPTRIGVRTGPRPVGPEMPIWFVNCWFALSRRAMSRVVDYVDAHPAFVRHFERTVIPVEAATATIVFNDPTLTTSNESLHHIRWSNRVSGRPDVFALEDLDSLVSSGAFFARKFDGRRTELLDALDLIVTSVEEVR
jgi:hypothetical protein